MPTSIQERDRELPADLESYDRLESDAMKKYLDRLDRVTAACRRMIEQNGEGRLAPRHRPRYERAGDFPRPTANARDLDPFFDEIGRTYTMNDFTREVPVRVIGVDFVGRRVGVVSELDGHTEWVEPACLNRYAARSA